MHVQAENGHEVAAVTRETSAKLLPVKILSYEASYPSH